MVFNYMEAERDFSRLLSTALVKDVLINWRDGIQFRVTPVKKSDIPVSPFEKVKGIKTNITMKDIVEAIREGREER